MREDRENDKYLGRQLRVTVAGYHKDIRWARALEYNECGVELGFRPWYAQVSGCFKTDKDIIAAFGESMDVNSVALVLEQLPWVSRYIQKAHQGKLQLPLLEQGDGTGKMFAHGLCAQAIALEEGLTGQRVRVWFAHMDKWYWGIVDKEYGNLKESGFTVGVKFDDGDYEKVVLSRQRWGIVLPSKGTQKVASTKGKRILSGSSSSGDRRKQRRM